ncbi:hypothetical protein [Planomonospora sp. ID82291]|uniref:hypothetical protein n=1 Tax=Planomonospora sp. ID82291 TaxID=2738136 RepID=UPI0018C356C3|nr:hypothetical protein [Planomonospora sp. ID82291]MBG0818269.1 hypothetical protein [Planomonospora sp. ID82291]
MSGRPSPSAQGCALLIEQVVRLLAVIALSWSALTTPHLGLAILTWALAALFTLALIVSPLTRHLAGSSR